MSALHHLLLPSSFGPFSIVWQETSGEARVHQVFLPREHACAERLVRERFPSSEPVSHPQMADLGRRIQAFLGGHPVEFALGMLTLERCPPFQQQVLRAESTIPRGWVSTYGRIASHIGVPGGARAVGNALARNPFPLVIPCHRAVRADGSLGGFRGGPDMKRALLELEGVEFMATGRVSPDTIYY